MAGRPVYLLIFLMPSLRLELHTGQLHFPPKKMRWYALRNQHARFIFFNP